MPGIRHHPPSRSPANRASRARAAALLSALWLAGALAQPETPADGAAVATGSGALETGIVVEKLQPPDPPARPAALFVPVGRLEAGDEVYYTIRVSNPGKQPVTDVEIIKRLPVGLHYVAGSATGPSSVIELSTDGGATFAPQRKDGDYTHLRWRLERPIAPGATVLLRFRATFR
jgi:uncharacterized repeat protein (TIGR01451 family)